MEVAITKISPNGQIVISADIRRALDIGPSDKFLVIGEGDSIILKKLKKESLKKEFEALLSEFSEKFKEMDITKEDVQKEIQKYRRSKRKSA
jgi:AbrB family looped-hinge helix DNA binding protein